MIQIGSFLFLAILILLGASIVIFAKNPVHNAIGLVLTLISLAVLYLTMSATFIAMVQILVYAGAVMTLFLFVIMMIGVDKEEEINGLDLAEHGMEAYADFRTNEG